MEMTHHPKYNNIPLPTYKIQQLNVDKIINPSTSKMDEPDQGGTKMVVIGRPGCFARNTKVLMSDASIKNIQNIMVGDVLFGDDSTPRTVTQLCHGQDEMYTIIPKFGQRVTVNKNHILSLLKIEQPNKGSIIDIPLQQFLEQPLAYRAMWHWFRAVAHFPTTPTPIDPYVMGFISNSGLNIAKKKFLDSQTTNEYSEYANLKRIPMCFIINSLETRRQLFGGIIDSYGVFNQNTKRFIIQSMNQEYIDQIHFIAGSLGYYSSKIRNTVSDFVNGCIPTPIYSCYIYPNTNSKLPTRIMNIDYNFVEVDGFFTSPFFVQRTCNDNYYGFTINNNHRFLLDDFTVVHNTGKTTLISSLFFDKKHIFPIAQIHSGTEDSNGFWQKMFPSTFVFNSCNVEHIQKIIKRQKFAIKHLPNPWAVLLLDDCTDDTRILNTPLFQSIFKNGRHWKMWFILSMQYALDIKPVIRTNVDVVFILREPNLRNREILYRNYASVIPTFALFNDIMDSVTTDYTALVINNASKSNNWIDSVYWYKAVIPPPNFKFGCVQYWDFHYSRYDSEKMDEI
jgi:hypothetical protein